MRLRVTKTDEFQFLTCLKHQMWGSNSARFREWKKGDLLAIIVDKAITCLAEVVGEPTYSKKPIWDNGIYPHRIPLKFICAFLPENRLPILGEARDVLTSAWGPRYGWGIVNQQLLQGNPADTLVHNIKTKNNDITAILSNIDQYLEEAKINRAVLEKPTKKIGRPKTILAPTIFDDKIIGTKDEESVHSKAQEAIIKLGKTSGCSVWIAANDRNRQFRGKSLGEGCLNNLPNLGLNDEAKTRISLIDVIWIKQNAPVCAFEIETTTSIYSGLLRMSDLISVVPALNIKLFIVAPRERQNKVMSELARPTFQKIGLSEFCRFIPLEELETLLNKVGDLQGYVHHSIMDTIAIELEPEITSVLD